AALERKPDAQPAAPEVAARFDVVGLERVRIAEALQRDVEAEVADAVVDLGAQRAGADGGAIGRRTVAPGRQRQPRSVRRTVAESAEQPFRRLRVGLQTDAEQPRPRALAGAGLARRRRR